MTVRTYWTWETTATLHLLGGARGSGSPTGEERGGGISCRHAHSLLHCALAAAQCIVIGPVCLFATGGRAVFVGGSVTTITRNYVHRSSPNWYLGKGSDHLQLIKFWPSRAPGKGSAVGRNFWLSLTTASAECLRLSERFFQWHWGGKSRFTYHLGMLQYN